MKPIHFRVLAPNRALLAAAAAFAVPAAFVPCAAADIPVVELTDVVHAVTAGYVVGAIDQADAAHAPLLILRIDTPGGLDTSMRQIVDTLLPTTMVGSYPRPHWFSYQLLGRDVRVAFKHVDHAEELPRAVARHPRVYRQDRRAHHRDL